MQLFRWYDRLIVAEDEQDARSLLREHYEAREIKRDRVVRVRRGPISLSIDNGDSFHDYSVADAIKKCGRGLIPDIG